MTLAPGRNLFRHDAIMRLSSQPDNHDLTDTTPELPGELSPDVAALYAAEPVLVDSDKLINFAWEKFGQVQHGWPRVQAISKWLHDNIEYRFMSGRTDLSTHGTCCSAATGASAAISRAILPFALNRTFNIPAQPVT